MDYSVAEEVALMLSPEFVMLLCSSVFSRGVTGETFPLLEPKYSGKDSNNSCLKLLTPSTGTGGMNRGLIFNPTTQAMDSLPSVISHYVAAKPVAF